MKYNNHISNKLDIRIFTTISGRVLIGELINVSDIGVELENVFLIDPLYPEGMVPIHQDSVMQATSIILYDNIIETETSVSNQTANDYIQHCLNHILSNVQLDNNNINFPKKNNKKNKDINDNTLFNWRDMYN
jgi:hypothetical protein